MAQWFVLRNEDVSGPYDTEHVKAMATQGEVQGRDLIWGKPQAEWKPISWWLIELPSLLSQTREIKDIRLWHYAVNGQSYGPFSREDLVEKLREVELASNVLVWTKGMKAWAPIYEFNDILDEIGINKRQFPRADLEGRVMIKAGVSNIEGVLVSISEGGFGANQIEGIAVGQVFSVEINSDVFYDMIHAKAEVRYITESGYVGFKFQHINMETKGAIIQYVKGAGRTLIRAA